MVSDFPENKADGVKTSLFADDSSIWKSGSSIKLIQKHLQNETNNISAWCYRWGFIINAKKTVSITFSNKTNSKPPEHFMVNNEPITQTNSVKFLGIIFDSKLSWQQHINYIVDRCKPRLNLLRMLSGHTWGAGEQSQTPIYRSLIRSIMEYGYELFVWQPKLPSKS